MIFRIRAAIATDFFFKIDYHLATVQESVFNENLLNFLYSNSPLPVDAFEDDLFIVKRYSVHQENKGQHKKPQRDVQHTEETLMPKESTIQSKRCEKQREGEYENKYFLLDENQLHE